MHEATLSGWALALGWFLRIGVPLLSLVIAADALRRSAAAFEGKNVERIAFVVISLLMTVILAVGMRWPELPHIGLAAILTVPAFFVVAASYLLRVVFVKAAPAAATSSSPDQPDATEES